MVNPVGRMSRRRNLAIRVSATPMPFVCVPNLSDYAALIRPANPTNPAYFIFRKRRKKQKFWILYLTGSFI